METIMEIQAVEALIEKTPSQYNFIT